VPEPQRILIVRLSHLGDVVQTLPLFHALRARYPAARIAWAVEPAARGLLDGLPGLDRTIVFERRGGVRAWFALRRELAAFAPDLAVDAQANWKSAAVAWLSGATTRLGPARADWRERSAHVLTNASAAPLGADELHAQERVLALAEHLCGPFELRRDPGLSADERTDGRDQLRRLVPRDGPVCVVQVGAAGDVRTPPDALLVDSAAELLVRGVHVLVTAGPSDAPRAAEVARALERRAPADGRTLTALHTEPEGLRRFAAWLAAASERGATLVCADSGPLHLAAAVGLRCVCLSGPFDPRRTGPWPIRGVSRSARAERAASAGPRHGAVVARPRPICMPCSRRRCPLPGGRICLERLASADVVAAVLDEPAP
jgi:ADP-heptose:LPS heptosyltransferase